MEERTCKKCGKTKPISMFSNIPYNYRCRECANTYQRKMYRLNRPAASKVSSEEFREIREDMYRSEKMLYIAIKEGKIPKASSLICRCGNPAKEYHHHNGYSAGKELDVVPLCRTCHGQEHRGKALTIV